MRRTTTMRTMRYEGARTFREATAPVPAPGPGEALLRVRRVEICGTDLHIFQGHLDHRVPRGGIIGHEVLAEVAEAPAGSGLRPGARVVVEPLDFCGECKACERSGEYLCYKLRVLGVDRPGGMQEYWTVPAERLLGVPDGLTDNEAALTEPLAIAAHAVRRGDVEEDETVLILGGGPIGALIAMVCRQRGAQVTLAEVNPYRIDLLNGLGFYTVGSRVNLVEFANDWTHGAGVDRVFEASGDPAAVAVMTDVLQVWGSATIVAIHTEPRPVDLYRMFARELTVTATRLYFRGDWETAIELAAGGTLPLLPLVSQVLPMASLQAGMELALAGGPVMKVLIDPTAG